MKTGNFKFAFAPLAIALTTIVAFSSCDKDNDNNMNMTPYTISGSATGSQVVPSNGSSGTGTITGTYDPQTRTMNYTTTWSGLTGAPTTAGFYNGGVGTNGDMQGTSWTFPTGTTGAGTMSGTMTLTPAQADQLTSGNWYYSYGTAANPSGEVRGQVMTSR